MNYPEFWSNSLRMDFRLLPAGTFRMGSPSSEYRRFADEEQHDVTLTNDFYLCRRLTTQAQWRALKGENPSKFSDYKEAPVENVSWYECVEFVQKLNEEEYGTELRKFLGEEWRYSLPTEAQWEYACRAGTTSAFYVGERLSSLDANFGKSSDIIKSHQENVNIGDRKNKTTPVGQFPENPWGFYDMIGNVCEWTLDGYSDYEDKLLVDPVGVGATSERVARGGSWRSVAENCRSASRFNFLPTYKSDNCGLRIAIIHDSPNT